MIPDHIKEVIEKAKELESHSVTSDFSAYIDMFLWLQSKELDTFVEKAANEIGLIADRKKRDNATQDKFIFSIRIILLNLLLLHKMNRGMLLAVPKAAGAYTRKNRFNHPLVSYRPFMEAYNGLITLGYIKIHTTGYWDKETHKGKVTRIDATLKLKDLLDSIFPQTFLFFTRHHDEETIKLKNDEKSLIDYEDTEYTQSIRHSIKVINSCLSEHWFDLDMSDMQFEELHGRMDERHKEDPTRPPILNLNDRTLYRVYNNGSKRNKSLNFKEGGRFYGGWWQGIPSEYRQYITIDQKHTVEVDYSNMHPAMMYAMKGLSLPSDAYAIEGVRPAGREMVKIAYNKLINGKKQLRRPKKYDENLVGMAWPELLEAVEEHHSPIKEYFRTGYGLVLQKVDADMAEQVLLYFCNRGIPCLPIHDSFIVHHARLDELETVMKDEYKKAMSGFDNSLKVDNYEEIISRRYAEIIKAGLLAEPSIEEMFDPNKMNQYDRRWYEWQSRSSTDRH